MTSTEGRFGLRKIQAPASRQLIPKRSLVNPSARQTGFAAMLLATLKFLFLPSGRISRLGYLAFTIASFIVWQVVGYAFAGLFILLNHDELKKLIDQHKGDLPAGSVIHVDMAHGPVTMGLVIFFLVTLFWISCMMFDKRIHDFNGRPWVRVLILFIPLFGALWVLGELFLRPGDDGENDYG